MTQLDLDFATRHSRRTDPETSHAAAASLTSVETHKALILAYLKSIAPRSEIFESIASAVHMEPHAVARRLPDLMRDGLIERTEETRRTSTGRTARCWRAK